MRRCTTNTHDGDAWDRLATVEALRGALANGGLTVQFQPIVTQGQLRPAGVEALVRWHDETVAGCLRTTSSRWPSAPGSCRA